MVNNGWRNSSVTDGDSYATAGVYCSACAAQQHDDSGWGVRRYRATQSIRTAKRSNSPDPVADASAPSDLQHGRMHNPKRAEVT